MELLLTYLTLAQPGLIGLDRAPDFVNVYYTNAERTALVCESARYRAVADLVHPRVVEVTVPGDEPLSILSDPGVVMELEAADGTLYSSRFAPKAARQNTWRAGLYYYDAHLLDFQLATEEGAVAPVRAEMVLHCFPDKLHLQAIYHVEGDLGVRQARLVVHTGLRNLDATGSPVIFTGPGGTALGMATVDPTGQQQFTAEANRLTIARPGGDWKAGQEHSLHVALFPGSQEQAEHMTAQERQPLDTDSFDLQGATFGGYDFARGLYVIHSTPGHSNYGFEGFWNNPNMYITARVEIANDDLARRIYLLHDNPAPVIEAAVLTDLSGYPLPVQVQASKNFGGENEEPIDVHFSESYYPVELQPNQMKTFLSHHLYQNWGDHPLRQVSSIRFFQIYYHLSQGTTETTCFSLPTKFGSIPGGEQRPYTIADYRPLSGQTWIGQPQHHHVALQGWLSYYDGQEWRWPRFTGTTLLSVGPNLAWFINTYRSSDEKVDLAVEAFEMPQDDQLRTHLRMRFDFREDVTIGGDPRHNLRLINKGSYIRRVHWNTLAWLDENGKVQTRPMTQDGEWSAEGVPMLPVNSFMCAYPHVDGNDAVVVRSFKGEIDGRPFNRLGFSAIGHPDNKSELMLTPLIEGNRIPAGSWLELDCILVPYGDDFSNWSTPWQESVRFGLNERELPTYLEPDRAAELGLTIMGPQVEVQHGERLLDLPPVVKVEDNWAEFTFRGAHDRLAVVATGFNHPKWGMLWEDSTYLDPQVKGGDGIQVMANADGTYAFVFAPRTRTTRSEERWRTTGKRYFATQAVSNGDIEAVQTVNGEVLITTDGVGETTLDSPRLWCPAVNVLAKERTLHSTRSTATEFSTVPVRLEGDWQQATCEMEEYGHHSLRMIVGIDAPTVLVCDGMARGGVYEVEVGAETQQLTADAAGTLRIPVPAGTDIRVAARAAGRG